jgi:hypothetical protein
VYRSPVRHMKLKRKKFLASETSVSLVMHVDDSASCSVYSSHHVEMKIHIH